MGWLEIFRTGTHTAQDGSTHTFGPDMLAQVAETYNVSLHEAPLVVGHPRDNAPAYGWVSQVRVAGDVLEAHPTQVEPQFQELVSAGRLKKISSSFYPPGSPNNPTPGKWYLRHVGFLGAMPPAVKGLKSAAFVETDGSIQFTENVMAVEKEEALKALEVTLKQREEAVKAMELKLKAEADAQRAASNTSFVEELKVSGRILPRQVAGVTALLNQMPHEGVVEFAENGVQQKKTLPELLKSLLKELPAQVNYTEVAPETGAGPVVVSFSAPPGCSIDADALVIHQKALEYQGRNPNTSYIQAVKAVGGR